MIFKPEDAPFRKLTITIETAEELDAIIAGLDHDRNHPVRRKMYEYLLRHRIQTDGKVYITPYREGDPT